MKRLQNEPIYEVDYTEGVNTTDLTSVSKVNNFIYKSQLKKRTSTPIGSQEKWLRDLQVENVSDIDWKEEYTIAFNCTASTKLRTFHFKFLLHRSQKMSPLFFCLSPFFSSSFAGLPPSFSFSLSFSCSISQICGRDN